MIQKNLKINQIYQATHRNLGQKKIIINFLEYKDKYKEIIKKNS